MGPHGCLRDEDMSTSAGGCNVDADCRGLHMGVSQKLGGTILGVPIIRIIVFGGLCWGPRNLGNCHISRQGFWGCLVQPSYTRTVGEQCACHLLASTLPTPKGPRTLIMVF